MTDASLALLAQPPQGQQQQAQPPPPPPRQQQQQEGQQQRQAQQQRQQQRSGAPDASSAAAAEPAPARAVQALNAGGLSITDATLSSLPGSLTALSLRGCKRVGDSGMLQLLAGCRGLARLDAVGCSQLTAAGFGCWTAHSAEHEADQQQASGPGGGGSSASSGCSGGAAAPGAEQALQLFRRAQTTAAAVQLQRAALPRQTCTREVMAWLAGAASSSGGGGGGGGGDPPGLHSSACSSGPPGAPLQRLELASCALLAEVDLAALAACCPSLKALLLPAAGAAAGSRLCAALGQHCRLLTRLTLCGSAALADADVALLLRGLPALQHLDCSGCVRLTGAPFSAHLPAVVPAAAAAAAAQPAAMSAQRSAAPAAAAAAADATAAAERGFALRTLRLDGCRVCDAAVVAIAGTCPHLEALSLADCRQLTAAAAAAALACCRNLRQLCVRGAGAAQPLLPPGGMPPAFPAVAAAAGWPGPEAGDPLAWLDSRDALAVAGGPHLSSALTTLEMPSGPPWLNVARALGRQCQLK